MNGFDHLQGELIGTSHSSFYASRTEGQPKLVQNLAVAGDCGVLRVQEPVLVGRVLLPWRNRMATPQMASESPNAILHLSLFKLQQLQVRASRGVSPKLLRNVLLSNVLNRALTVVSRAAPSSILVPTSSVRSSGRSLPVSNAKTSAVTEGLSGLTLEQRGGQPAPCEPVGNGIRAAAELELDSSSDVSVLECPLTSGQLFDSTDSGASSDEENPFDDFGEPFVLDIELLSGETEADDTRSSSPHLEMVRDKERLSAQPDASTTGDRSAFNADVNTICPSPRPLRKRSRSEMDEEPNVDISEESTKKARLEDGLASGLWYEHDDRKGSIDHCAAEPTNIGEFGWTLGSFAFGGLDDDDGEELGSVLPNIM